MWMKDKDKNQEDEEGNRKKKKKKPTIRNDTGYCVFYQDSMKIAWDFITGGTSVNKINTTDEEKDHFFFPLYHFIYTIHTYL